MQCQIYKWSWIVYESKTGMYCSFIAYNYKVTDYDVLLASLVFYFRVVSLKNVHTFLKYVLRK